MMLIGVTGHAGCNKTAVCKRLEKAHGFSRFHAGDPVKQAVMAGTGVPSDTVDGKMKDHADMRLGGAVSRDLLERTSAAWHEEAPHLTSTVIERRATKRMSKGRNVVVDGVRSPVEAAMIKSMGGTIVRAHNGTEPDPEKPMDRLQMGVQADMMVNTSGKKADIKASTDRMLDQIAARKGAMLTHM